MSDENATVEVSLEDAFATRVGRLAQSEEGIDQEGCLREPKFIKRNRRCYFCRSKKLKDFLD